MATTYESHVAELLRQVEEALLARDGGRALYLMIREVGGDPLAEELVVISPETGRSIGYIVPAAERHALLTREDFEGMMQDARDYEAMMKDRTDNRPARGTDGDDRPHSPVHPSVFDHSGVREG